MKQEEIEQVAKEWAEDSVERVLVPNVVDYMRWAYESGAKWAEKYMIEKACNWLEEIDFSSEYFYDGEDFFENAIVVEDFRKAMEE